MSVKEVYQTARLATQTTLDAAQTKFGDDKEDIREELDTVIAADALKAVIANFTVIVIAGADNSSSHDYTAAGVTATSTVFAALAFKHQDTIVATVAGSITPGATKITVAGGADLSTFFLVFLVIK